MENFNNDVFGFGSDINEEVEQTKDFNYDSISGLGESNYENEDLFDIEVDTNNSLTESNNNDYRIGSLNNIENETSEEYFAYDENIENVQNFNGSSIDQNSEVPFDVDYNTLEQYTDEEEKSNVNNLNENIDLGVINNDYPSTNESIDEVQSLDNTENEITMLSDVAANDYSDDQVNEVEQIINQNDEISQSTFEKENYDKYNDNKEYISGEVSDDYINTNESVDGLQNFDNTENEITVSSNIMSNEFGNEQVDDFDSFVSEEDQIQQEVFENDNSEVESYEVSVEDNEEIIDSERDKIIVSDTPIEELNKLTEYEEDEIEETDINALFDKVSVNVKDASDIFRKNTDLKQKIDTRFEQLKKLQSEISNARQKQLDEISAYKEEVFNKLTEKKEEIEKRLNLLKESQAAFEKEKQEFELYKKQEQQNIDKVQKEVQSAYDDRREELSHIEDVLRKQKDALDEERSQLSLDRIQYESDKNELANNLLKFNELVNSFTNGMSGVKE